MEIIDQAIYLNLDKRTDRREHMETQLKNIGFAPDKITRYSAIYNPLNGLGCLKSHLEALKLAKSMCYKAVWIFEDDFAFTVDKETVEYNLRQLMFKKPQADVALAGYIHKQPPLPPLKVTIFPNLFRVIESQTASSYIVFGHYFDKLIDLFEDAYLQLELTGEHWHYANDQVWKLLQVKDVWYCFTPSLGQQRPDKRDNSANASSESFVCYADQG